MTELIQFKPLCEQIKTLIIKQMADGRWSPGQRLPSELQLGDEFGVSQGTVRKALDVMTREAQLASKSRSVVAYRPLTVRDPRL